MNKTIFSVKRSAHVYELGEPGQHIRQIWIVCHGYAQLAGEFLANFSIIDTHNTLVVAPEGLNYFYKKDSTVP